MRYLFWLFILVPTIEISLIIVSGKTLGIIPTIALLFSTSLLGAYLAKQQGMKVMQQFQQEVQRQLVPSQSILDGVCVLSGSLLLLTPGFASDILGVVLMFPPTRQLVKPLVMKAFESFFRKRQMIIIK